MPRFGGNVATAASSFSSSSPSRTAPITPIRWFGVLRGNSFGSKPHDIFVLPSERVPCPWSTYINDFFKHTLGIILSAKMLRPSSMHV